MKIGSVSALHSLCLRTGVTTTHKSCRSEFFQYKFNQLELQTSYGRRFIIKAIVKLNTVYAMHY